MRTRQQPVFKISVIGEELYPVRSYELNIAERSETTSAVLCGTFVFMKQFKSGAKQFQKNILGLLNCRNFDIEVGPNDLRT